MEMVITREAKIANQYKVDKFRYSDIPSVTNESVRPHKF